MITDSKKRLVTVRAVALESEGPQFKSLLWLFLLLRKGTSSVLSLTLDAMSDLVGLLPPALTVLPVMRVWHLDGCMQL
ncbi:hypothetical protein GN956_G12484 [Arapaima gigas]